MTITFLGSSDRRREGVGDHRGRERDTATATQATRGAGRADRARRLPPRAIGVRRAASRGDNAVSGRSRKWSSPTWTGSRTAALRTPRSRRPPGYGEGGGGRAQRHPAEDQGEQDRPRLRRRSVKRSCSQTSPTIGPIAATSPNPPPRNGARSRRTSAQPAPARQQGTVHLGRRSLTASAPRPAPHGMAARLGPSPRSRPARRPARARGPLREDRVAVLIGQDDVEAVIAATRDRLVVGPSQVQVIRSSEPGRRHGEGPNR